MAADLEGADRSQTASIVEVGAWLGKLFFQRDSLLYAGPVGPARPHRHHALQVVLSLASPVTVGTGGGTPVATATAAVIGPDVEHAILRGSPSAVLLYLDLERRPRPRTVSASWPNDPRQWIAQADPLQTCIPSVLPETWPAARKLIQAVGAALGTDTSGGGSEAARRIVHPAIVRARRYVEANLARDVRAEAVANAAGVSASRLAQLFASDVGVPLRRYVRWQRLRTAMTSLHAGANLATAAADAAFADGAHLTRTFREMFGIAPSEIMAVAQWVPPDVP